MPSANFNDSIGLPNTVIKSFYSIFSCYPEIDQVILYGSRAKGIFREGSDIDDLLLPYSLDISLFSVIDNPDLIHHINRVGKVIYQKSTT
jgi:uncharacterized protein